jgi:hypothetical protein
MCLFLVRVIVLFMGLTALWHGWKSVERPAVVPVYRSSVPSEPPMELPDAWVNPAYRDRADQEE